MKNLSKMFCIGVLGASAFASEIALANTVLQDYSYTRTIATSTQGPGISCSASASAQVIPGTIFLDPHMFKVYGWTKYNGSLALNTVSSGWVNGKAQITFPGYSAPTASLYKLEVYGCKRNQTTWVVNCGTKLIATCS
ncbi:MAG: hypothetical protein U1B30_11480 [Pseudomonadota bacterium]|nr:hypothetical protein [Pseudomonadota bacterium]